MEKECLGCGAGLGDAAGSFCGKCWEFVPDYKRAEIYKARALLHKDASEGARLRLENSLRAAAKSVRK